MGGAEGGAAAKRREATEAVKPAEGLQAMRGGMQAAGGRKHTRKLNFDEFQHALELVADEKGVDVAVVHEKICNGGLALATGTKAADKGVVDRLTDAAGYTGSHKERFDADGKGLGMAGRVQQAGISDLSQVTNRAGADVRGVQP